MTEQSIPYQPLTGVEVVDLTHLLAGPYCTQLLADAGATVTKVEPPGGEWSRRFGNKRLRPEGGQVSAIYAAVNRGKRSIVVDLKNPSGREIVRRLISRASVVVENFSPGTLDRLGLGLVELRKEWPRLITASISLFGGYDAVGLLSTRGGLAGVAEAESGIMSQHRSKDNDPLFSTEYALGDMAAGLATYGAIVTALFERERSGQGRHLDVAMTRVLLSLSSATITAAEIALDADMVAESPRLGGMGVYTASDGHVVIAANNDGLFTRLLQAMNRSDLVASPLYASHSARTTRVEEINAIVENWARTLTVQVIVDMLSEVGVPCGRVNTPAEIVRRNDPRFRPLDTVADGLGGELHVPANPLGFGPTHKGLPQLGSDTRQVIEDAFPDDPDALDRLRDLGALGP